MGSFATVAVTYCPCFSSCDRRATACQFCEKTFCNSRSATRLSVYHAAGIVKASARGAAALYESRISFTDGSIKNLLSETVQPCECRWRNPTVLRRVATPPRRLRFGGILQRIYRDRRGLREAVKKCRLRHSNVRREAADGCKIAILSCYQASPQDCASRQDLQSSHRPPRVP